MPYLIHEESGETYQLEATRSYLIGRGSTCDIRVKGSGVSLEHAELQLFGENWLLTDKSSNGIYINGTRMSKVMNLTDGDYIAIPPHTFIFQLHDTVQTLKDDEIISRVKEHFEKYDEVPGLLVVLNDEARTIAVVGNDVKEILGAKVGDRLNQYLPHGAREHHNHQMDALDPNNGKFMKMNNGRTVKALVGESEVEIAIAVRAAQVRSIGKVSVAIIDRPPTSETEVKVNLSEQLNQIVEDIKDEVIEEVEEHSHHPAETARTFLELIKAFQPYILAALAAITTLITAVTAALNNRPADEIVPTPVPDLEHEVIDDEHLN